MKHFLIKYRLREGAEERRRAEILAFIAALDADPELRGNVTYRCMKVRGGGDYIHIASTTGEAATAALQSRDFFKLYTEQTESAAAGEVEVEPLEIIAETSEPSALA